MKVNRILCLIFTLIFLLSCADNIEKVEFQESDRNKIVFLHDLLSQEYLNSIVLKNHIYEKGIDSVLLETYYKYNCDFWKNDTIIGGFISSTYEYPTSDPNEMEKNFSAYILGQNINVSTSPGVRYERTFDFYLPFETYRVYKIYMSDTLNFGLVFNILKENKIINVSIITNDKFELELNKLIEKVNKI